LRIRDSSLGLKASGFLVSGQQVFLATSWTAETTTIVKVLDSLTGIYDLWTRSDYFPVWLFWITANSGLAEVQTRKVRLTRVTRLAIVRVVRFMWLVKLRIILFAWLAYCEH